MSPEALIRLILGFWRSSQTFNYGEDNTKRLYFGIDSPFDAVSFEDADHNPLLVRERLSISPSTSYAGTTYEIVPNYAGRRSPPGGPGANLREVTFISLRTHKVYDAGTVNLHTIVYRFSWAHLRRQFGDNPHIDI